MRRVNLFTAPLQDDAGRPDGFGFSFARLGPQLGAKLVGATVYELPPGQTTFPYHYEYGCEEWLLVVTGRPTLRDPEGEHELEPGDFVCFPEGPDGAHGLSGSSGVRALLLSTTDLPANVFYPDSGEWRIRNGADDDVVLRPTL